MNSNVLKVCQHQVCLPLLGKLIASSLLIGVLSGIITRVNAQSINQSLQVRESEAKQYVNSIARSQQAFYQDKGKFAATIQQLGVNVVPEDKNYFYGILPPDSQNKSVLIVAKPYTLELKGYVSGVFVTQVDGKSTLITGTCETVKPGLIPGIPKPGRIGSNLIECPVGFRRI